MMPADRAPVATPWPGATARRMVPPALGWIGLAQPPGWPASALKKPWYPPGLRCPVFFTVPLVALTPTAYGTANMSTWVLLSHRPSLLSVYSAHANRMLRLASVGLFTSGWTRPPVVTKNLSFWP